jgi:diaminopimelate decarboxylase
VDQINFDRILKMKGVHLSTLSVHIGSQIVDHQKLIQSYEQLILLADQLNKKNHTITNLDFGGGFGVMDHSDDTLDFNEWKKELQNLLKNKNYHIIFEPGRFIVADSGELITKILYIKNSGDRTIIITDASFSEYLRPALYEIDPPIQTISNSKELKNYDIAGGICESTDFLAKNVNLPEVKVGDYLKFTNVGAYGSSMSSTYNSRPRPLEVLMGKNEYRVIRSRDTLEDLCKNEIM